MAKGKDYKNQRFLISKDDKIYCKNCKKQIDEGEILFLCNLFDYTYCSDCELDTYKDKELCPNRTIKEHTHWKMVVMVAKNG